MRFSGTVCNFCGAGLVHPDQVAIAYRIRQHRPIVVALDGQQPWVGIRVLCAGCREFVATAPVEGTACAT